MSDPYEEIKRWRDAYAKSRIEHHEYVRITQRDGRIRSYFLAAIFVLSALNGALQCRGSRTERVCVEAKP